MVLNAKQKQNTALNTKLRIRNGSECQNKTVALNAKPKETPMNANLKQKLCMPDRIGN